MARRKAQSTGKSAKKKVEAELTTSPRVPAAESRVVENKWGVSSLTATSISGTAQVKPQPPKRRLPTMPVVPIMPKLTRETAAILNQWRRDKNRRQKLEVEINRLQSDEKRRTRYSRSLDELQKELDELTSKNRVALAQADVNELARVAVDINNWWSMLENRLKYLEAAINRLQSDERPRIEQSETLETLEKERDELNRAQQEREEIIQRIEPQVNKKSAKEKLCPVFKTATDDVFEITKIIVPVLITLAATNVITVTVAPGLFAAGAALVVARMTVSALCADVDKQDKKQKP
jgi:DNA repair exonuclease SbcCD ATPase subunit